MNEKAHTLSVFEQIQSGLEDSIAHSTGRLSLVTTELPEPPPKPGPQAIAAIRKKHHMSQAVFAATLNVSTKTIQSWEQGRRKPSDAALRMLQLVDEKPDIVTHILRPHA
jgi:putative transcriptional regulator